MDREKYTSNKPDSTKVEELKNKLNIQKVVTGLSGNINREVLKTSPMPKGEPNVVSGNGKKQKLVHPTRTRARPQFRKKVDATNVTIPQNLKNISGSPVKSEQQPSSTDTKSEQYKSQIDTSENDLNLDLFEESNIKDQEVSQNQEKEREELKSSKSHDAIDGDLLEKAPELNKRKSIHIPKKKSEESPIINLVAQNSPSPKVPRDKYAVSLDDLSWDGVKKIFENILSLSSSAGYRILETSKEKKNGLMFNYKNDNELTDEEKKLTEKVTEEFNKIKTADGRLYLAIILINLSKSVNSLTKIDPDSFSIIKKLFSDITTKKRKIKISAENHDYVLNIIAHITEKTSEDTMSTDSYEEFLSNITDENIKYISSFLNNKLFAPSTTVMFSTVNKYVNFNNDILNTLKNNDVFTTYVQDLNIVEGVLRNMDALYTSDDLIVKTIQSDISKRYKDIKKLRIQDKNKKEISGILDANYFKILQELIKLEILRADNIAKANEIVDLHYNDNVKIDVKNTDNTFLPISSSEIIEIGQGIRDGKDSRQIISDVYLDLAGVNFMHLEPVKDKDENKRHKEKKGKNRGVGNKVIEREGDKKDMENFEEVMDIINAIKSVGLIEEKEERVYNAIDALLKGGMSNFNIDSKIDEIKSRSTDAPEEIYLSALAVKVILSKITDQVNFVTASVKALEAINFFLSKSEVDSRAVNECKITLEIMREKDKQNKEINKQNKTKEKTLDKGTLEKIKETLKAIDSKEKELKKKEKSNKKQVKQKKQKKESSASVSTTKVEQPISGADGDIMTYIENFELYDSSKKDNFKEDISKIQATLNKVKSLPKSEEIFGVIQALKIYKKSQSSSAPKSKRAPDVKVNNNLKIASFYCSLLGEMIDNFKDGDFSKILKQLNNLTESIVNIGSATSIIENYTKQTITDFSDSLIKGKTSQEIVPVIFTEEGYSNIDKLNKAIEEKFVLHSSQEKVGSSKEENKSNEGKVDKNEGESDVEEKSGQPQDNTSTIEAEADKKSPEVLVPMSTNPNSNLLVESDDDLTLDLGEGSPEADLLKKSKLLSSKKNSAKQVSKISGTSPSSSPEVVDLGIKTQNKNSKNLFKAIAEASNISDLKKIKQKYDAKKSDLELLSPSGNSMLTLMSVFDKDVNDVKFEIIKTILTDFVSISGRRKLDIISLNDSVVINSGYESLSAQLKTSFQEALKGVFEQIPRAKYSLSHYTNIANLSDKLLSKEDKISIFMPLVKQVVSLEGDIKNGKNIINDNVLSVAIFGYLLEGKDELVAKIIMAAARKELKSSQDKSDSDIAVLVTESLINALNSLKEKDKKNEQKNKQNQIKNAIVKTIKAFDIQNTSVSVSIKDFIRNDPESFNKESVELKTDQSNVTEKKIEIIPSDQKEEKIQKQNEKTLELFDEVKNLKDKEDIEKLYLKYSKDADKELSLAGQSMVSMLSLFEAKLKKKKSDNFEIIKNILTAFSTITDQHMGLILAINDTRKLNENYGKLSKQEKEDFSQSFRGLFKNNQDKRVAPEDVQKIVSYYKNIAEIDEEILPNEDKIAIISHLLIPIMSFKVKLEDASKNPGESTDKLINDNLLFTEALVGFLSTTSREITEKIFDSLVKKEDSDKTSNKAIAIDIAVALISSLRELTKTNREGQDIRMVKDAVVHVIRRYGVLNPEELSTEKEKSQLELIKAFVDENKMLFSQGHNTGTLANFLELIELQPNESDVVQTVGEAGGKLSEDTDKDLSIDLGEGANIPAIEGGKKDRQQANKNLPEPNPDQVDEEPLEPTKSPKNADSDESVKEKERENDGENADNDLDEAEEVIDFSGDPIKPGEEQQEQNNTGQLEVQVQQVEASKSPENVSLGNSPKETERVDVQPENDDGEADNNSTSKSKKPAESGKQEDVVDFAGQGDGDKRNEDVKQQIPAPTSEPTKVADSIASPNVEDLGIDLNERANIPVIEDDKSKRQSIIDEKNEESVKSEENKRQARENSPEPNSVQVDEKPVELTKSPKNVDSDESAKETEKTYVEHENDGKNADNDSDKSEEMVDFADNFEEAEKVDAQPKNDDKKTDSNPTSEPTKVTGPAQSMNGQNPVADENPTQEPKENPQHLRAPTGLGINAPQVPKVLEPSVQMVSGSPSPEAVKSDVILASPQKKPDQKDNDDTELQTRDKSKKHKVHKNSNGGSLSLGLGGNRAEIVEEYEQNNSLDLSGGKQNAMPEAQVNKGILKGSSDQPTFESVSNPNEKAFVAPVITSEPAQQQKQFFDDVIPSYKGADSAINALQTPQYSGNFVQQGNTYKNNEFNHELDFVTWSKYDTMPIAQNIVVPVFARNVLPRNKNSITTNAIIRAKFIERMRRDVFNSQHASWAKQQKETNNNNSVTNKTMLLSYMCNNAFLTGQVVPPKSGNSNYLKAINDIKSVGQNELDNTIKDIQVSYALSEIKNMENAVYNQPTSLMFPKATTIVDKDNDQQYIRLRGNTQMFDGFYLKLGPIPLWETKDKYVNQLRENPLGLLTSGRLTIYRGGHEDESGNFIESGSKVGIGNNLNNIFNSNDQVTQLALSGFKRYLQDLQRLKSSEMVMA